MATEVLLEEDSICMKVFDNLAMLEKLICKVKDYSQLHVGGGV